MPYFKQSTGRTHTTHTTKTKTTQNSNTPKHSHTHKTHTLNDERQRLRSCCQSRRRPQDRRRHNLEEGPHTPQRLEKIPPGFGLVGIIIRDQNIFSARDKRPATSKQLQTGVRSRRTSCTRSSSSRVKGTRRGAGSATCSSWQPAARAAPAAVR